MGRVQSRQEVMEKQERSTEEKSKVQFVLMKADRHTHRNVPAGGALHKRSRHLCVRVTPQQLRVSPPRNTALASLSELNLFTLENPEESMDYIVLSTFVSRELTYD